MAVMTDPERGTDGWFKEQMRCAIEYTKAVDAFAASARKFQKLTDLGAMAPEDPNVEVAGALHASGVVYYARPFKKNFVGAERRCYPKQIIEGDPDFSEDIHSQLIELRDKLIAHSDAEYADGRLFQKVITIDHNGTPKVAFLAGFTVATQTVHALLDTVLIKKCLTHIRAAERVSYADLGVRLHNLTETGRAFPDAFVAAAGNLDESNRIAGVKFELPRDAQGAVLPQVLFDP